MLLPCQWYYFHQITNKKTDGKKDIHTCTRTRLVLYIHVHQSHFLTVVSRGRLDLRADGISAQRSSSCSPLTAVNAQNRQVTVVSRQLRSTYITLSADGRGERDTLEFTCQEEWSNQTNTCTCTRVPVFACMYFITAIRYINGPAIRYSS